jgi:hypothetical protein
MENSFNSRAGKRSISNSSKMNDNQNSSKEKNEPNNLNIVIEIDKNQKLPEVIKKPNIENHPEDAEALNSEKKNKKFKRRGLDLLNEELEELIQKVTNESKEEAKQNKPSRRLIKRKRKSKTYKDSDESYVGEDSFDEYKYKEKDKDSIYLFRNYHNKKNENDYDIEESEDNTSDDEEIKNFLIRKTCQAKTLSRYKDLYKKKKNNRIIFLKEEDEENYFKNNENLINNESGEIEKSKKNENIADDDTEIKNRKHLKKLKKDIDNKEMGLPLDAECIICCSEIRELANPDGCNHDFCRSCLIEWSQRSAKCPICKTLYNNIFVYENGIKKQISLNEIRRNYKKENNSNESEEENIEKICYICKKNEDESNLIICERCKACFCHYYCIKLKKKPPKWYCRYCRKEIKEIRENKKKIVHFFL